MADGPASWTCICTARGTAATPRAAAEAWLAHYSSYDPGMLVAGTILLHFPSSPIGRAPRSGRLA